VRGSAFRGKRVNVDHQREMQGKTKSIRKVENLSKLEFSVKDLLLKKHST
jgi:hypothetical protein